MPPREFVCQFPGCRAGYSRKEHLIRHEAQHSQRQSFPCPTCSGEFGRTDTLRRHMRQIHGVNGPTHIKQACAHCRKTKVPLSGRITMHPPTGGSDIPPWSAGCSNPRRRFLDLYFEKFHPYWLLVHRGSFNEDIDPPLLVQAMVVIGMWMSDEPNARSAAIDLHNTLASAISQQREEWDVSATEDVGGAPWPIATYQGILLHIIFALVHAGTGNLGIDLKHAFSRTHTDLLNSLIGSCKRLGMLYYPHILTRYSQRDSGPYIWLGIEEIKRFNLALYRVYRAASVVGKRANNNTDIHARLTARDLQFPFPTHTRLWKTVSMAEWGSAAARGVFDQLLDDTMEEMWISKVHGALGVDWELDYTPQD